MIKVIGIKSTLKSLKIDAEKSKDSQKKNIMSNLVNRLRDATPVDTGEASQGWKTNGVEISNDVEHISLLNKGTSSQAPAFFVERTILSQKGISPNGVIVRSK